MPCANLWAKIRFCTLRHFENILFFKIRASTMGKTTFLIAFFIFLMAGISSAAIISIQTTIQSTLENGQANLDISLKNNGDEIAYNVQTEFFFEGKTHHTPKISKLGINQTITFMKSIVLPSDIKGDYPLIMLTHYADANDYLFSALSCIRISTTSDTPPMELSGNMEGTGFSKKGRVIAGLKNLAQSDLMATLKLWVPRELKTDNAKQNVSIPPKTGKEITFEVENFSALPGSNYQVYAIAEYDKDGFHQTCLIPGQVSITKSRQLFGISYKGVIGILVFFICIFITAQFIKKGNKP